MLRLIIALLALAANADPIRLKILTFKIWLRGGQVSFASVIKAIQLADAYIVGLLEPDGKPRQIAAFSGNP